jgi:hypothetical protein
MSYVRRHGRGKLVPDTHLVGAKSVPVGAVRGRVSDPPRGRGLLQFAQHNHQPIPPTPAQSFHFSERHIIDRDCRRKRCRQKPLSTASRNWPNRAARPESACLPGSIGGIELLDVRHNAAGGSFAGPTATEALPRERR